MRGGIDARRKRGTAEVALAFGFGDLRVRFGCLFVCFSLEVGDMAWVISL